MCLWHPALWDFSPGWVCTGSLPWASPDQCSWRRLDLDGAPCGFVDVRVCLSRVIYTQGLVTHPRITQSDRLRILGVTCTTSRARSKVSQKEGRETSLSGGCPTLLHHPCKSACEDGGVPGVVQPSDVPCSSALGAGLSRSGFLCWNLVILSFSPDCRIPSRQNLSFLPWLPESTQKPRGWSLLSVCCLSCSDTE